MITILVRSIKYRCPTTDETYKNSLSQTEGIQPLIGRRRSEMIHYFEDLVFLVCCINHLMSAPCILHVLIISNKFEYLKCS